MRCDRCCVFLMGPMASATVMDFGISTSRNILLDIMWLYTYIYISYTYKETATLDISDFWYKHNIIYIHIIYTVLLCNLYIYICFPIHLNMLYFSTKSVGSKECSQTGNQVKQAYTMAIHGCLSLISAQALGCWCWNAKAVAEVGELVMFEMVKFLCPKWMALVGKVWVWSCWDLSLLVFEDVLSVHRRQVITDTDLLPFEEGLGSSEVLSVPSWLVEFLLNLKEERLDRPVFARWSHW